MSGELVRAFASLLKNPENFYRYKRYVNALFGDVCVDIGEQIELYEYYSMDEPSVDPYLPQDSIVKIYVYLLSKHGFKSLICGSRRILWEENFCIVLFFASKASYALL